MTTVDRCLEGEGSAGVQMRLIAIDPGERHVGVAAFLGTECIEAWESGREEFYLELVELLGRGVVDVVVYETFQLYADKALAQTGSEMGTCECIGVIKYLCGRWPEVRLVGQPAMIQEGTRSILRAKRVVSFAKRERRGPHAFSAELHGQYYIRRGSQGSEDSGARSTGG
jgi:hypothetical protein